MDPSGFVNSTSKKAIVRPARMVFASIKTVSPGKAAFKNLQNIIVSLIKILKFYQKNIS